MAFILLTLIALVVTSDGRKFENIGVVRELWSEVPGNDLQSLLADDRFPHKPTVVSFIRNFDAPPSHHGKNIAQRLKGYFVAPLKGEYKFYSSCEGSCEIFLNLDGSEGEKNRIITQQHSTRRNQFEKYPEQASNALHLKKGQVAYLEAINKQGTSNDTLSVGVKLPNGDRLFPIPSDLLRKTNINSKARNLLSRRNLKKRQGPVIDLDGKKFNDKDAIEPGINIFQESTGSDVMAEGDFSDSSTFTGKKNSKMNNIVVDADKTNQNVKSEDIENIKFSENEKLNEDSLDSPKKKITNAKSRTFKNQNLKVLAHEKTGSFRNAIGIGHLDHGPMGDHLFPPPPITDIHPEQQIHPHEESQHPPVTVFPPANPMLSPSSENLKNPHVHGIGPGEQLRHTGKVALIPAMLHRVDAHVDPMTGAFKPAQTRIEPMMPAPAAKDHNDHLTVQNNGGKAVGVLHGDPHHGEVDPHDMDGEIHHDNGIHIAGEGHDTVMEEPQEEELHPPHPPPVAHVEHPPVQHVVHAPSQHIDVHPYNGVPPPKRKPDIVKVEFVPEDVDVKPSGNTKVGSKKGGSVRVQFIPGEQPKLENVLPSRPAVDTRTSSSENPLNEEVKPEGTEIPSNAIASKIKNKLQGKEEKNVAPQRQQQKVTNMAPNFPQKPAMIKEARNTKNSNRIQPWQQQGFSEKQQQLQQRQQQEQPLQQNQIFSPQPNYKIIDASELANAPTVKSINGYEANPQLPSMGKTQMPGNSVRENANLHQGEPFQRSQPAPPQQRQQPQSPEFYGTDSGMQDGAGGELKPGEERIDPPFTALGQKYPGSITSEEKEATMMENNKAVPGQDRVFFGGGPAPVAESNMQAPSQDPQQPNPIPTQNAPETASIGANGFNPVASHLSSALADNTVSPEEALQMMNDFVSGNQDMNKAAKNIEGMLGQIASTRHTAPSSNEPILKPPADVAAPISDENQRFISNPNDVNPNLNTGYSDPNLNPTLQKSPELDSSIIPSTMFDTHASLENHDMGINSGRVEFQNNDKPTIDFGHEQSQTHMQMPEPLPPQDEEPPLPPQTPQGEEPPPPMRQEEPPPPSEDFHDESPPQAENRQTVMSKLNQFSTNGPPPAVDVYEGQIPELNKLVQQNGETRSRTSASPSHTQNTNNNRNKNNGMVVEPFQSPDDGYANPTLDNTGAEMRKLIPDLSSGTTPISTILDKMDPHEIPGSADPSAQDLRHGKHSQPQSWSSLTTSLLEEGNPKFDSSLVSGFEQGAFVGSKNFDLSLIRSKPISSELSFDTNQPIGRPMSAVMGTSSLGLATSQFERKFKTPHPEAEKSRKIQKLAKQETNIRGSSALAEMYQDSLFPEDKMDIASLEKSLEGNTLTSYDNKNRVRSKVPSKPRHKKPRKMRTVKGRKLPITKKLRKKKLRTPKDLRKLRQHKKKQPKKRRGKSKMYRRKHQSIFKRQRTQRRSGIPHQQSIESTNYRVNKIRTDAPEYKMATTASLRDIKTEPQNHDSPSGNSESPQQEHASLRKLVKELKNVLHEIKEAPQLTHKHVFLNGERQLTDDDILSMEDVNKSDLLGAFTSMRKLKAMQEQIHIPNTADFNQDMYGPGDAQYKRSLVKRKHHH